MISMAIGTCPLFICGLRGLLTDCSSKVEGHRCKFCCPHFPGWICLKLMENRLHKASISHYLKSKGSVFHLFYEKWVHPFEFCGLRVPGGDFSKMNGKTTSRLLQLSGSIQIFEFLGAEMK